MDGRYHKRDDAPVAARVLAWVLTACTGAIAVAATARLFDWIWP